MVTVSLAIGTIFQITILSFDNLKIICVARYSSTAAH